MVAESGKAVGGAYLRRNTVPIR